MATNKKQQVAKLTKHEVYIVEYWWLEELFEEYFKDLEECNYELVADLNANNDSIYRIDIEPEDEGDPGINVGDFDDENSEITTQNLMIALAHRGIIPYGTYIIEVCW